jgi:hypothetical protein
MRSFKRMAVSLGQHFLRPTLAIRPHPADRLGRATHHFLRRFGERDALRPRRENTDPGDAQKGAATRAK